MDTKAAVAVLSSRGQSTRLDIFRLLARHGDRGLPAGEIASALKVAQNTMSSHLAILARSGVLRSRRYGRSIVYRVEPDVVRRLTSFLLKDSSGGNVGTGSSKI